MHLIIFVLYGLSRLYHLKSLPLFIDEALYIRWIDSNQPFISLTEDGQPPLFFIISQIIKNIFQFTDSMLLIRIISVIMGGLALWYGMKLTKLLIPKSESSSAAPHIFGLLYLTSPFMAMYDRLGMRDSAITAFFFATFYHLLNGQVWLAGSFMAIGILTKSTAWFIPLMVLVFLLTQKVKLDLKKWISLFAPLTLAVGILLVTQTADLVLEKNTIFIQSPKALLAHTRNNLYQTIIWLWQYLSPPVFIGILSSLVLLIQKPNRKQFGFVLALILPILIEIVIAKIYFPRYFLLSAAGLLLVLSLKVKNLPLVMVISLLPLVWSFKLITNPATSPLPQIEEWQYLTGWPAGTGISQTADFIASYQPDYLVTDSSELLRTGLTYYRPELAAKMAPNPSYQRGVMALNLGKALPPGYNGTMVFEFTRPDGGDTITVYSLESTK